MDIRWKIGIVGCALSVAAVLAFSSVYQEDASDKALRARFITHRADFVKLVAMSQEDKNLSRIAFDFTWLRDSVAWPRKDVGFSNERWADYRREFRIVGAAQGIIIRQSPPRIIFPISSTGLVPSGSEKGIVYSQELLTPVLKTLDKRPPDDLYDGPDHSHVLVYKPIYDHWYIYYEEW